MRAGVEVIIWWPVMTLVVWLCGLGCCGLGARLLTYLPTHSSWGVFMIFFKTCHQLTGGFGRVCFVHTGALLTPDGNMPKMPLLTCFCN